MTLSPQPLVRYRGSARILVALLTALCVSFVPIAAKKKKRDDLPPRPPRSERPLTVDQLKIVDCLLPGQVRQLGRNRTYITQRRPARLSAEECAIRGGEHVAYDRANYETALAVWSTAASAGDAEAQYYVGRIYDEGMGRESDHAQAAEWYRKAAEQGYAPAQVNLGFLLEKGLGVEADPLQAVEWYRKASGVAGVILLESEVERMRAEIEESQERLTAAERDAVGLEAQLTEVRSTLDAERASGRSSAAHVKELEARLASTEKRLSDNRSEIARLETTRTRHDLAGPKIEIVDSGRVRSAAPATGAEMQKLVGRIDAPAGLARFLVNDTEARVDPDGFFEIDLASRRTLTLVAIDRQGKRDEASWEEGRATSPRATAGAPVAQDLGRKVRFGDYFALVIGNRDYQKLTDLITAEDDARAMADLLERRYGFRTRLLVNATIIDILSALNTLRDELRPTDNLLIYYAGHGELDPMTQTGFWLPVDADPERRSDWLSSNELSDQIESLRARHVIVIADSCYSGALTRSSIPVQQDRSTKELERWMRENQELISRTALTSGGLKPVLDQGGGGHSVFTRALLDVLSENSAVLDGRSLWSAVRSKVEYQTKRLGRRQVPEYAPLRNAGHGSGEFLLRPASG